MYYFNFLFLGFFFIFLLLGLFIFRKQQIVKLKFTKRICRIVVLYLLFLSFIILICPRCLTLILFLIPCIICVLHIIYIPIEKGIYRYYFIKARNKLSNLTNLNIGITGSFGKTSVKNYLYEFLIKNYYVLKSPNSYNTPMGLSKTINLEMNDLTEIFISELGATRENDIKELVDLIPIEIGVITEIGHQHLESFKSIDNVLKTKLEILNSSKIRKIYINNDNVLLKRYNYPAELDVIRIGTNIDSDSLIKEIKLDFKKMSFVLEYKNISYFFETTLLGKHNIQNLAISITIALDLNIDYVYIYDTVRNLKSVKHRLELEQYDNIQIIDDSFNSNIKGFINALEVLNMTKDTKILITPGIVELPKESYTLLDVVINMIIQNNIVVYGIRNKAFEYFTRSFIQKGYKKYLLFDSFKEAYVFATKDQSIKKTVLIENDLTDYYLGG